VLPRSLGRSSVQTKKPRVLHQGHVGVLAAGTKRRADGQHDCVLADKELYMPGVLPAELGELIERGGLKPRSVVRLRDYIVDGPITARWAGPAPHAAAGAATQVRAVAEAGCGAQGHPGHRPGGPGP